MVPEGLTLMRKPLSFLSLTSYCLWVGFSCETRVVVIVAVIVSLVPGVHMECKFSVQLGYDNDLR